MTEATQTPTTATAMAQLGTILRIIEETIGEAGPAGLPSGHLYAALMTQGCTLPVYQAIIGALESEGRITREFDILRIGLCNCGQPYATHLHDAELAMEPNEEITVLCRKCNAPTDPDDSGLCLGCDQDYPAFCAGCGEPYHASELGIDSHRCRHCRTGR